MRIFFVALCSFFLLSAVNVHAAAPKIGHSGLPVPRFVHLKNDLANARIGPSKNYAIRYQYKRQGLPLQVIAETSDNQWRKIQDFDGATAWVHKSQLVSGNAALVSENNIIYRKADEDSAQRARLAKGVLVEIKKCQADIVTKNEWCEIRADQFRGYVQKSTLWGVN